MVLIKIEHGYRVSLSLHLKFHRNLHHPVQQIHSHHPVNVFLSVYTPSTDLVKLLLRFQHLLNYVLFHRLLQVSLLDYFAVLALRLELPYKVVAEVVFLYIFTIININISIIFKDIVKNLFMVNLLLLILLLLKL